MKLRERIERLRHDYKNDTFNHDDVAALLALVEAWEKALRRANGVMALRFIDEALAILDKDEG